MQFAMYLWKPVTMEDGNFLFTWRWHSWKEILVQMQRMPASVSWTKKFSTKYNGIPDKAICGSTHFAMMLALLALATVLCSVSFVEGTVFLMPHFRTIPPNLIKVSYLFSLQPWLILSLSSFVLLNYYY